MGSGRDKLSATKVASHNEPGYLLDGGGLYLQVALRAPAKPGEKRRKPSDHVTKSWCFRYRDRATGKLRELGLGSLTDVTLAHARSKAAELRLMLQDGKDPKTERANRAAELRAEVSKVMTFDEATAKCIADKRAGWKNAKHAQQWENTLATYASPIIGNLPVASIDLALVRKVIDPIWDTKHETASRVRQRIEAVLAWATVHKKRSGDNPARWENHLEIVMADPSKVRAVVHHPALPYLEIGEFTAQLREQAGVSPLALEFLILTAARTGEVIGARWEEFDLEKRIWTVPAVRMKAKKVHTVPLSPRALEIVKEMAKTKVGGFVFPGWQSTGPLSNMALSSVLKRMKRAGIVVHGFRSTFRDWAGEMTNFPHEMIEYAMAHKLKDKAEAAYARGTMAEKRRKLMDAWAQFCDTPKVVRPAK